MPDILRNFQQTNLDSNNNKFWNIRLVPSGSDYMLHVHNGRVGSQGQHQPPKQVTQRQLDALIASKVKKGYREIILHKAEIEFVDAAADVIAPAPRSIDPEVEKTCAIIMSEAGESINSYLNTTVDAISRDQIIQAMAVLRQLQTAWSRSQDPRSSHIRNLATDYFNLIPTKLPARINPDEVIRRLCSSAQNEGFDEQDQRLQQLSAALMSYKVQRQGGSILDQLGVEMRALEPGTDEYRSIVDRMRATAVHGYTPRVKAIFEVTIPGERTVWNANHQGKDRVLRLYHGTHGRNVRHILRTGLICPRTASNGRMYGDGIYFAIESTKSTNYCAIGDRTHPHMIFLADVAVGKMYETTQAMSHLKSAPQGYDSVWGVGRTSQEGLITPSTRRHGSALMYHEFIVYNNCQQTIRYLVLFDK